MIAGTCGAVRSLTPCGATMMPDDPSVSEALDVLQQSASHETE